ncbi:MAG: TonB family protein [Thermoanaerobaculia bacterium]
MPISDLTKLDLNAPLLDGRETAKPWSGAGPGVAPARRPEPTFAFSPEVTRLRKKARVIVIELPPEDLEVESEESKVRGLAFPRLNDHVVGGDEAPRPWPEPDGGLRFTPLAGTVVEALELREVLETPPETAFRIRITRERAISASIIAHLLVLLLLVVTPNYRPKVPAELNDANDPLGLMRLWKPDPTPPPIPLQFFPAPGPKAASPGKNPLLSDKDRKAHGGDPKLPPLAQPKAVAREGIRDLEAGRGASGGAVPTPPPARSADAGDSSKRERSLMALRQDRSIDSGFKPGARIPPPPLESVRPEDVTGSRGDSPGAGGDSGDFGAGYEREGGFVDSGALSFDTQGYDWGAYAAEMLRKIKRNWDVPSLAHYGVKGRLVIRFFILKDGTVDLERILLSSQKPPYDNAAFQAIARSSRFRPLPDDLGKDREGVTITFFYNIRPEEERSDAGAR